MRRNARQYLVIAIVISGLLTLTPACMSTRPAVPAEPTPSPTHFVVERSVLVDPTPAPTATRRPTETPPPTATPRPTDTPAPTATVTETHIPTATASATASETPAPTRTPSATVTASATPTSGPPPRVAASFPIDGDQGVPAAAPLRLVFSTPMDLETLRAGLRIAPPVAGNLEQVAPAEYLFRGDEWQPATEYHVTLVGARSFEGVALPEWPITFATHADGRVPLPILMYHRITELPADASAAAKEWATAPDRFVAQLDYLRDSGHGVISLDQLAGYLAEARPLPSRPVAITFDDGFADFYDTAWPALQSHGFTATMFVIASHAGYGAFLNWEQIEKLERAGIAFGSHSLDHTGLKGLPADELRRQVVDSKVALDAHLQTPVTAMTYAYGSYDENAIMALVAAGYSLGLTINPTRYQYRGQPYRLNRIHAPYDATIEEFAALLH